MNREYSRICMSENSDRPLAGVYGAARPLSHGLSCVRFPFHLPANSAIQPSRKGLFAFLDWPIPGREDDRGAASDRDWWAAHGKPDIGLAKLAALARKADGCRGSSGHGLRTKRI